MSEVWGCAVRGLEQNQDFILVVYCSEEARKKLPESYRGFKLHFEDTGGPAQFAVAKARPVELL